GMYQKIFSICEKINQFNEELIYGYFDNIKKPKGLVFCDNSTGKIIQNIETRKHIGVTRSFHYDKRHVFDVIENQKMIVEKCMQYCDTNDVKYITLDMSNNTIENVNKMFEFINNL
ncbi:MAG: hypothetical protein LAT80_09505, partial [Balneolaceae bacterium]|nr:hypothetical protein [Balneolaceae bacterium]